ncbi:hypothetical protein F2Q69_00048283 [Brassica cretica]|uniref:Uncharacterized protein n=1 Tax=Brassica cretica TaxID=69181 RepID=A0A8S9Q2V9_BRACR|nr:hypothetical protein F2Q69_00048283 [Brassica cretica]
MKLFWLVNHQCPDLGGRDEIKATLLHLEVHHRQIQRSAFLRPSTALPRIALHQEPPLNAINGHTSCREETRSTERTKGKLDKGMQKRPPSPRKGTRSRGLHQARVSLLLFELGLRREL